MLDWESNEFRNMPERVKSKFMRGVSTILLSLILTGMIFIGAVTGHATKVVAAYPHSLESNGVVYIEMPDIGAGSGFVVRVTPDSIYVMTAAHVVLASPTQEYQVAGQAATVVGYDGARDIAVLEIENTGQIVGHVYTFASPSIGDRVTAMGFYPSDVPESLLMVGHVSGFATDGNFVYANTGLQPGMSGGPLVNSDGAVVGINSYMVRGGMGWVNPTFCGFATGAHLQKFLDAACEKPQDSFYSDFQLLGA